MHTVTVVAALALATAGVHAQNKKWSCSSRVELSTLWAHLRTNYDKDHDGRVEPAEYTRGEIKFKNYDRNGDGELTAADFPPDAYINGFNHMFTRFGDSNRDRKVTGEEWAALIARADPDADGEITADHLDKALGRSGWTKDWPLFLLSFDQDQDGKFTAADLRTVFDDQDRDGNGTLEKAELEGWQQTMTRPSGPPPAVGAEATDFDLPRIDAPDKTIKLSSFEGDRPVALLFGSYT